MRFRLRTLLIVLALGPPLIWFGWTKYEAWKAEQAIGEFVFPPLGPPPDLQAVLDAMRRDRETEGQNSYQDDIWTPPNTPLPPDDPFATP